MTRTSLVMAVALATVAQVVAGWWGLTLVGFGYGVFARNESWPALRFGAGVLLTGALLLGWMAWRGAPVGELAGMLDALMPLPVLPLSLLLPAVVGVTAATLGAALGRRFLFG